MKPLPLSIPNTCSGDREEKWGHAGNGTPPNTTEDKEMGVLSFLLEVGHQSEIPDVPAGLNQPLSLNQHCLCGTSYGQDAVENLNTESLPGCTYVLELT